MKYWRGYLIAGILAVAAWALNQFAAAHTQLVDMVYPYMTRVLQTSLAQWSGGVEFCLWQLLLLLGIVGVLVSVVLMVVLRWNPIQWFGWVLTAVAVVHVLNVGLYGMNEHSGSIAQDVRLQTTDYSVSALEDAASFYLGQAMELSSQITRDSSGNLKDADFEKMAQQAADGFKTLTYEKHYAVFAGSLLPVKQLSWSGLYGGVTGKTVALTGEAAVNPDVPAVGMPFAICKEMAHRMSIARDGDANFAAFMACTANEDTKFVYSGYLMAFRECYHALASLDSANGKAAFKRVEKLLSGRVESDLQTYNNFVGNTEFSDDSVFLLVNWHIQTVVIPSQEEEADKVVLFDPLDETDERIADLLRPAE